jgi:hypothetical protein
MRSPAIAPRTRWPLPIAAAFLVALAAAGGRATEVDQPKTVLTDITDRGGRAGGAVQAIQNRGAAWRSGEQGLQLAGGGSVKTGPGATGTLRVQGVALVHVGNSTLVQIPDLPLNARGARNIRLEHGDLWVTVMPLRADQVFTVETSSLVGRGGNVQFHARHDLATGQSEMTVYSGRLDILPRRPGRPPLPVGSGQRVAVTAQGIPRRSGSAVVAALPGAAAGPVAATQGAFADQFGRSLPSPAQAAEETQRVAIAIPIIAGGASPPWAAPAREIKTLELPEPGRIAGPGPALRAKEEPGGASPLSGRGGSARIRELLERIPRTGGLAPAATGRGGVTGALGGRGASLGPGIRFERFERLERLDPARAGRLAPGGLAPGPAVPRVVGDRRPVPTARSIDRPVAIPRVAGAAGTAVAAGVVPASRPALQAIQIDRPVVPVIRPAALPVSVPAARPIVPVRPIITPLRPIITPLRPVITPLRPVITPLRDAVIPRLAVPSRPLVIGPASVGTAR